MTQEFYGKNLARYKLERAKEELDTAELLFNNDRLKAAKVRHASDYDEFYIAGKEEAARQIQTAKVCIDLVDKFITGG